MTNNLFRAVAETHIDTPKPVPSGKYTATFISYSIDQLPPWINFVFKINNGEHKNKKVGYSVKPKLTVTLEDNLVPTLFSITSALLGRKVELKEFIDLDDLLGLSCIVSINKPKLYEIDLTIASKITPIKKRNI